MHENSLVSPHPLFVGPFVEAALREDIRTTDITTAALIPQSTSARAHMNFRSDGVVCGMEIARQVFQTLDATLQVQVLQVDGEQVAAHSDVLRIEGKAAPILTGERVALNIVQRLSATATLTRRFAEAIAHTSACIVDTRKTTPGWRVLEKYAVRCGGGANHRFALDDLILIKDNHVALCGGIGEAVRRARNYAGHAVKVEIECDTLEQVQQALEAQADIILLDNMTPEMLRRAVEMLRQSGQKVLSEASGGVNLQTVRAIAESGVDFISVGALTHSAGSLDVGLDVDLQTAPK